jgi:hypothetical protein
MRPLELGDLLPTAAWEHVRPAWREALIAYKKARRVALGPRVTLVFENRETMRWQVQEMARVERLEAPSELQRELDIYNDLVPGDGELAATLLIEITDLAEIRPELDRLIGLDEHVTLVIGTGADALRVPARFDPKQLEDERIAAVQYIHFPLGPEAAQLLEDAEVPACLRVGHPRYTAETLLTPETRASLLRDLAGGMAPLLDLESALAEAATSPGPPTLRMVAPENPAAEGHVVLEAHPAVSHLEAEPELLTKLALQAREVARELSARHGACRLEADLTGPVRWHLIPGRPRPDEAGT